MPLRPEDAADCKIRIATWLCTGIRPPSRPNHGPPGGSKSKTGLTPAIARACFHARASAARPKPRAPRESDAHARAASSAALLGLVPSGPRRSTTCTPFSFAWITSRSRTPLPTKATRQRGDRAPGDFLGIVLKRGPGEEREQVRPDCAERLLDSVAVGKPGFGRGPAGLEREMAELELGKLRGKTALRGSSPLSAPWDAARGTAHEPAPAAPSAPRREPRGTPGRGRRGPPPRSGATRAEGRRGCGRDAGPAQRLSPRRQSAAEPPEEAQATSSERATGRAPSRPSHVARTDRIRIPRERLHGPGSPRSGLSRGICVVCTPTVLIVLNVSAVELELSSPAEPRVLSRGRTCLRFGARTPVVPSRYRKVV